MKDYFDYIIYLAFQSLLEYEDKREITIEQLHNYRVEICRYHQKAHERYTEYDDKDFEAKLKYFHKRNRDMSAEEEQKKFTLFIQNNSAFFTYENGVIRLKQDISHQVLEDAKFELDCYDHMHDKLICGELLAFFDSVGCLNILGAKRLKEEVTRLILAEKIVESAYQDYQNMESKEEIKRLAAMINSKLYAIGNMSSDKMGCYSRLISHLDYEEPDDDFELLSDNLVENDEFFKLKERWIDHLLSGKYIEALFGTETLAYIQLESYFSAMWMYKEPNNFPEVEPIDPEATTKLMEEREEQINAFVDEFSDDEEDDSDEEEYEEYGDRIQDYLNQKRIDMFFYLTLINKINNCQSNFGSNETLEKAKRRLIYLLDAYGDNLYNEENYQQALATIKTSKVAKTDLDDFYILSRLFLIDISSGWIDDNYTLRKLLFASVYYDLTKDRRIKRMLDNNKKTEMGAKVYNAIIKNDFSGFISPFAKGPVLVNK